MTIATVRHTVGLGLVAVHFGVLALVGILTAIDRFAIDELFLVVGLLGPLFAAYTTAIVRSLLADSPVARVKTVGWPKAALALGIPAFFCLVIVAATLWKAFGSLELESLVKIVGLTETLLGAYVGLVIGAFFGPLGDRV
jgi:hypothetical protein